jgi:hypothetical protein
LCAAQPKSANKNVKVHRSFENLKEINVEYDINVKYDPSISEVIMKPFKNLKSASDYNNTFSSYFGMDGCDEDTYIVLKTKLNKNVNKYHYVTFVICPSAWHFEIYKEGNGKPIDVYWNGWEEYGKPSDHITGYSLVIPGNGSIYTSGHVGNFNVRRKYDFADNKITEVPQPFFYVGLKSYTLRTVNIYQDKTLNKIIATLPPNNEIEILLTESPFTPSLYLVRTSFGLTGWAELSAGQYQSVDVEGLFYNND